MYLLANIALNAASVVANSFLTRLVDTDQRDATSSRGWAIGYLGGGLNLALCLVGVIAAQSSSASIRLVFVFAGLWWAGIEVGGRRLPGAIATPPSDAAPERGTAATSGPWTVSLAVVVVATLAIASVSLAGHALGNRESATGTARAEAVARAASWIEANVPPGTRIGFGSFLGYETAVDLAGRYPMVQIHQTLAVVDPTAPLGLAQFGASPIDDWIAIDVSRREREFYAFRASSFGAAVIKTKIAYYVYLSGPNTSVPALLGVLTAEHGFRLVDEATFVSTSAAGAHSTTALHVFAVDPAAVDLGTSRLFATPLALDRLVGLLVDDAETSPATAARLAGRATTWPDPAAAAPILARLRAAAAR